MKDILNNLNLSLADLEGTSNEVLSRIVGELKNANSQTSHSSHSSSSGSGHYSHVTGAGHKEGSSAKCKDTADE